MEMRREKREAGGAAAGSWTAGGAAAGSRTAGGAASSPRPWALPSSIVDIFPETNNKNILD